MNENHHPSGIQPDNLTYVPPSSSTDNTPLPIASNSIQIQLLKIEFAKTKLAFLRCEQALSKIL